MKKTRIRHVELDWNGTLRDDLQLAYDSTRAIFDYYNISPVPTVDDYRDGISSDFMRFYYAWGFDETTDPADLNKIRHAYFKEHADEFGLHAHVGSVLDKLQQMGIGLGVLSAEIEEELRYRIKKHGLDKYFDKDHTKGSAWPKRFAFEARCRELFRTYGPDEICYVGDTDDDIWCCKLMGIRSVAFGGGYNTEHRLKETQPDHLIYDLRDIIKIVKG